MTISTKPTTIQKITNLTKYHKEYLFLFALILFPVFISHYFLGNQSLRLDESQSIWQVNRPFTGLLEAIGRDVHLPLFGTLLFIWRQLFGGDIVVNRRLSLVFFAASIPMIFALGNLITKNKRASLYLATIFAISPFLNWFGNELRMYSLLIFITLSSHYFYLKIYLQDSRKFWTWFGYGFFCLLGIYTHYFFWLIIISQMVFLIGFYRSFSKVVFIRFLIAWGCLFAALLPWVFYVAKLGNANNSSPHLIRPTSIDFFNTFSNYFFGFQSDPTNTIILSSWPFIGLFSLLLLQKNNLLKQKYIYLLIVSFLPIIGCFLVSWFYRPIFLSRYLSITLSSLYTIAASLLFSQRLLFYRFVSGCLVATMFFSLGLQVWGSEIPVKENYRGAISYLIEKTDSKKDIIAISAPFTIYPFDYYYNGDTALTTIPLWDRKSTIPAYDEKALEDQLTQIKKTWTKIYLLMSYDQGYETKIKQYFDSRFPLIDSKNFSVKLNLLVYDLENPLE